MSDKPVACVSFCMSNLTLAQSDSVEQAVVGLRVIRSPSFEGEVAGRVGNGVGIVKNPDLSTGNIAVWWPQDSDLTIWTRADNHGFDVVVSPCNARRVFSVKALSVR